MNWFCIRRQIVSLTIPSKQVFSRSAPTLPVNPIRKAMLPMHIRTKAGSNTNSVNLFKLLKASFSFHAQIPAAKIIKPDICGWHNTSISNWVTQKIWIWLWQPSPYIPKKRCYTQKVNTSYSSLLLEFHDEIFWRAFSISNFKLFYNSYWDSCC